MPGMTGEQLAEKLLAIRPDIPIILMTGFSHIVDESKAPSIGVKEFVMKPISRQKLSEVINRIFKEAE